MLEEWGPAARLREHLEAAAEKAAREDARRNQAMDLLSDGKPKPGVTPAKRADFDPLPANGVLPPQKNECAQQYTLADSADGGAIVLEVAVGRYLDTAEIKVDVQPLLVRCLVRGRLLQLHTPEVRSAWHDVAAARLRLSVREMLFHCCRRCAQTQAFASAPRRQARCRWSCPRLRR